jgi:myo-inositol-1(or 4)-monophosphatase
MNGRRLATTEHIIAVYSPNSDEGLQALEESADEHDVDLSTVPVGESITDVYRPAKETLGVTLGGDGTYLEGVRAFSPYSIPFLGVNTGTLAFLASVSPSDLQAALDEVLAGRADVDQRQQLHVDADGVDCTGINDVMIKHVPPENPIDRKITQLQVFTDDEYVGEYEGTGVAVSTPTGSTGVALSAGGPIHYPKNNETLQITPLHTHRLGVRPLVVDADTSIQLVSEGPAHLLVDGGRAHTSLERNDTVTISGASTPAQIVNTSYDDHFFTSVSEKLGWSIREGRYDTETVSQSGDSDEALDVVEKARQVAAEAARSAGDPLRELHGETESVETKSDNADIVTEADYKSENIITTVIKNEFPEHGILSEETVHKQTESEYMWVIDPLDGTGNFANGNPNYSVSIALIEDESLAMGVVYAPETDELFSAVQGGDALRNDVPITTTSRDRLDESMLLSGYDPDGTFLSHCYHETRGVRRLGSAALNLCYLASGSADAVWEYDTYPWDIAAGVVIARAAGAKITDTNGSRYVLDMDLDTRKELIGSNGSLHTALLDHLDTFEAQAVTGDD